MGQVDLSRTALVTVGPEAFYDDSIDEIILPPSTRIIGQGAFAYTGLTTIDLENTQVQIIDTSLFEKCGSLTTVRWPRNLIGINPAAFKQTGLTGTLDLRATQLVYIDTEAFNEVKFDSVRFPSTLRHILGPNAFTGIDLFDVSNTTDLVISQHAIRDGVKSFQPSNTTFTSLTNINCNSDPARLVNETFCNCNNSDMSCFGSTEY